jgi:hypothetical protein
MFANLGGERKHVSQRHSLFKRPLAGALDDWAIGERITERDAEFNYARAGVDGSANDVACGGEVRVAAGYVGDERGFVFEMKGHVELLIGDW